MNAYTFFSIVISTIHILLLYTDKPLFLFSFIEVPNCDHEKQPPTDCFWIKNKPTVVAVFVLQCFHVKNILTNRVFLLVLGKNFFLPIPGISKTPTQTQRLSRPGIIAQIHGLSRIFKDCGNPVYKYENHFTIFF